MFVLVVVPILFGVSSLDQKHQQRVRVLADVPDHFAQIEHRPFGAIKRSPLRLTDHLPTANVGRQRPLAGELSILHSTCVATGGAYTRNASGIDDASPSAQRREEDARPLAAGLLGRIRTASKAGRDWRRWQERWRLRRLQLWIVNRTDRLLGSCLCLGLGPKPQRCFRYADLASGRFVVTAIGGERCKSLSFLLFGVSPLHDRAACMPCKESVWPVAVVLRRSVAAMGERAQTTHLRSHSSADR